MVPDSDPISSPLPATLLKRLAEAVDGLRDGKPHWFVIDQKTPHRTTPFNSKAEADNERLKRGEGSHIVLGPFVTPADAGAKAAKMGRVRSVQIFLEGSDKPVEIKPDQVDAIFLSVAALDKFVYPYYCRLYGVAETARMRDAFLNEQEGGLVFHTPWTEYLEGPAGEPVEIRL